MQSQSPEISLGDLVDIPFSATTASPVSKSYCLLRLVLGKGQTFLLRKGFCLFPRHLSLIFHVGLAQVITNSPKRWHNTCAAARKSSPPSNSLIQRTNLARGCSSKWLEIWHCPLASCRIMLYRLGPYHSLPLYTYCHGHYYLPTLPLLFTTASMMDSLATPTAAWSDGL